MEAVTRGPRAHGRSDDAIIEQSLREPEHFAAIFDRYYDVIHGYAARRLGPGLADDVAAETFLIAFSAREKYDLSQREARPWLYGIASNLISRHARAESRRWRALARACVPDAAGGDPDRIEARLDAQALRKTLAAVLAEIPRGDPRRRELDRDGPAGPGQQPGRGPGQLQQPGIADGLLLLQVEVRQLAVGRRPPVLVLGQERGVRPHHEPHRGLARSRGDTTGQGLADLVLDVQPLAGSGRGERLPLSGASGSAFDVLDSLLYNDLLPPGVEATIFHALAIMPGVTLIRHTSGIQGGPAIGISYTDGGWEREEILLDPSTYAYLGERDVAVADYNSGGPYGWKVRKGQVWRLIVRKAAAVVDHNGQLPPGVPTPVETKTPRVTLSG